ncbi:hypothetical protein DID88_001484 [Monilinia fructigena]|uniref:Glycine cleavage system P-protein N-terminal domain-containing protein n=1 Tax=Monilinia fructigena TaxID=38457 RepID=A0A395J2L0_9HELO|nr:hypothetical protein DID88_001484 [Monilinia fructigena]
MVASTALKPTGRRTYYKTSVKDETINSPSNLSSKGAYAPLDTFVRRHIGPDPSSTEQMLKALDPPVKSLDEFVEQVLPRDILSSKDLKIDAESEQSQEGFTESQLLERLKSIASENMIMRSYIGCGYAEQDYTPYQPEISQGRLESLLNFQTLVSDLTALPISNASLLDEPTAAAEAMTLSMNALPIARQKSKNKTFFPNGFDIKIEVGDVLADGGARLKALGNDLIGALVQYPDTEGGVEDFRGLADIIHAQGATFSVATDLLALTVLTPPGEFGADIAFGNAQRFGVPFGYGGPHAAFFAVSDKYKRKIPGRLIGYFEGQTRDKAMRLALQTREQHIRREKATSNVCTAQALLANMSAFYAVYHGPEGLKAIAERAIKGARFIQDGLKNLGFENEL